MKPKPIPSVKSTDSQKCSCPCHEDERWDCPYCESHKSPPSITRDDWEKEAQDWMDKLSILDVLILNNIVSHKMDEARKEEEQRWINQPANEHDKRIRAEGRQEGMSEAIAVTSKMIDHANKIMEGKI